MKALKIMIFATSIFLGPLANAQKTTSKMEKFTLVIHGGAGTILKKNMTEEKEIEYRKTLHESLMSGYSILLAGGGSTDAVEAAIKVMEDSPLFNAGRGSVFNSDGKNEMDASIMEGKNRNAGAVAQVNNIKNPIQAARAVMNHSPHVMMVGDGAITFAKEQDLEMVDSAYFYDERRWKQWEKLRGSNEQELDHSEERSDVNQKQLDIEFNEKVDHKFGTVGAVAIDKAGNITAGTSTGGMTNKMYGRIGDSPIIGSGTYADNKTCGVSCTGHGEFFMRAVVAYDIAALMEYKGLSLQDAANEVVNFKLKEFGGGGGIIAVDAEGNYALTFNTEGMYRGAIQENGEPKVFIYKD